MNKIIAGALVAGLTVASLGGAVAQAGVINTLASLSGSGQSGKHFRGGLASVNNVIYAATAGGGTNYAGAIVSYSGSTLTTVASFTNGADPNGVVAVGNVLYGTTYKGGTSNLGTLFSFDPSVAGGAINTIQSFGGSSGYGASPIKGLISVGGVLYGTTSSGGTTATGGSGSGTIFSYDPSSNTFTKLYTFSGSDGSDPQSVLVAKNGVIYGTTKTGGTGGGGTIFAYSIANKTFSTLANFSSTAGSSAYPRAGLTIIGNKLYGLTSSDQKIFSYSLSTTPGTLNAGLASVSGAPADHAIAVNGKLFGVTSNGGGPSNDGTLFSYTPGGSTSTLFSFSGGTNGATPSGPLLASNGNVYGTTYFGGSNNDGTLFSLDSSAYQSTPVPEPSALAVMVIGLFGMGIAARTRRRTPRGQS